MTRYKLKPPARSLSEPAYPHLSLENLPLRPGPNRVKYRNAEEKRLALRHYRGPHERIIFGCPECASVILTLTWGMSAAWFPAPEIPKGFTR